MTDRRIVIIFDGKDSGAVKLLNQVSGGAQKTEGTFSKLGNVVKLALAGSAVAGIGAFAKSAIGAASDVNESLSKSNTVFGASGKAIEVWSKGASRDFGQSQKDALDAAGTFGNMFTQLQLGQPQAAAMSQAMTELASDFASFHNADITEVIQAQTAAFRGEYDSVQRFVPTINAAAVENAGLALGLAKTTKELTAQDKAVATYELMLRGAGAAMGDFDRTSGGLANKQRTLSAVIADVKAQIGAGLMPVVTTVTGWLADNLPRAVDAAKGKFNDWKPTISAVVGFLKNDLLPAGQNVAGFLLDNLQPALAGVGVALTGIAVRSVWTSITAGMAAVTAAGGGMAGVMTLIGGPVTLVIAAVAALAAGLVYAYKHSETFRNVVDAVFRFVARSAVDMKNIFVGALQFMVDKMLAAAEWITRAAATAFGWVPGIGGKLKTAAKAVEGFRDSVNSALNGIKAWDPTKAGPSDNDINHQFGKQFGSRVKRAVNEAKPDLTGAGTAAGSAFSTGLGKAVTTGTKKTMKEIAAETRGFVGDILAGFTAIDRRADARRGVVAAQETLNEALARQALLPVEIARAERELAAARAEAAKTTTDESLAIVQARQAVTAAERNLDELRRGSKGTTDEILMATLELKAAREDLAETEAELVAQGKARSATAAELLKVAQAKQAVADAQERLAELQGEGTTTALELQQATLKIAAAKEAAAEAERELAEATKAHGLTASQELGLARSRDAVAAAEKKLRLLQDGTRASADDLEEATLDLAAARDRLSSAQRDAKAPTDAVRDAEQKLKDLLDDQTTTVKAVKEAQDALNEAKRQAIEAELAYAEAAAKSKEVTADALKLFQQLAIQAGLSSGEVKKLTDAFNGLRAGRPDVQLPNLAPIDSKTGRPGVWGPGGQPGIGEGQLGSTSGVTVSFDMFGLPTYSYKGKPLQSWDNPADSLGRIYFDPSMIPGFAEGVENFRGGLAYVHQDELLVNLPAGTDVFPSHRAGGGGDVVLDLRHYRRGESYDGAAIVDALLEYQRRNGDVPIKVRVSG